MAPARSRLPAGLLLLAASLGSVPLIAATVWRAAPCALFDVPVGRYGADIKAPVLVLSAGKDALFDRSHHDALLRAIPHAQGVVLPDLGHNLIFERPRRLAR